MPMPDHPTPTLHQAAEALLEAIDDDCGDEVELNRLRYEELTGDRMHPKMRPTEMEAYWVRFHSWVRARVVTLRAALSAEEAWRARAEAAIAVLEAEETVRKFSSRHDAMWWDKDSRQRVASMLDRDNALDALQAARRRYEETCRAG